MSYNPFATKKALPVTYGTDQMVSEGVKALEALPDFLASLGDAEVSEFQVWENAPITASIFNDLMHTTYGWNGERWVEVGF